MITKDELKHILTDTESYHIERTISIDNADKFCQAICAFSNDLPGSGKNGYLIIGAHDNGKLSCLKVNDKLLLQISNIRTDGNILPQPVMTVEKFSFEDGEVLVAEVQPSEFPSVRYRGRVWVRVGPRKSIASEAEEKILTERRLSNVHTFDAMPCLGTTMADLDVSLIKREFLPKAVDEEVLAEDKRPIEDSLPRLVFTTYATIAQPMVPLSCLERILNDICMVPMCNMSVSKVKTGLAISSMNINSVETCVKNWQR